MPDREERPRANIAEINEEARPPVLAAVPIRRFNGYDRNVNSDDEDDAHSI